MSANKSMITKPIVSKLYCSPSNETLVVRRRPKVANGGGFVVVDSSQKVVFRVDGCGIIGRKDEMILRDREGNALLLIRRNGSMVEALSMRRQWKGTSFESHKLVFIFTEPHVTSCFWSNKTTVFRISVESKDSGREGSLEVRGDFPGRWCRMVDWEGKVVAEIGGKGEQQDLYSVEIKGGMDKAFVCGVIAVLDYIYHGSTTC